MKELKGFLARQNASLEKFPIIKGRRLIDIVDERVCDGTDHFYSWLTKDRCVGLVLEVYGVKRVKGRLHVQKLMAIPEREDVAPLIRNCWYGTGMAAGLHSYGYTKQNCKWYGYGKWFDFMDERFPVEKCWSFELFGLERLVELDESLKWCAYGRTGYPYGGCIQYIRLYRKHPQTVEMLMKAGLPRMLTEKAVAKISSDRRFAYWLMKNRDSVRFMACKTAYDAYRKNPNGDPRDYQKSLGYRIQCGRESAFRNKEVYRKALKFATQERIAEYIWANTNKESYGDYLVACDWLKLDFSDTKVLFPHDFRAMHDLYTEQYAEHVREEMDRDSDFKADGAFTERVMVAKRMKDVAERFSFLSGFKADGYCILVASSKDELIDEGFALHHCVGRMDYDRRQADGKSVICFLRRESAPDVPYVTVEVKVSNTLSVSQCYGNRDRVVPEVDGFVKEWMKYANRRMRRTS